MKEEILDINETCRQVTCKFEESEIKSERNKIINRFCKEVNIRGFRKGKVPSSVIETQFQSAINQQLESEVLRKAIDMAFANHSDWDVTEIVDAKRENDGDGMICTITVNLIPNFEISGYDNLSIDAINVVVEDFDVENEVKSILRQYAKYDIVSRAAENGDFVKLNYIGKFEDGNLVSQDTSIPVIYGSQTNTWEEVGKITNPGFQAIVNGIIGMSAGEKKTVVQDFGMDFENSELTGKRVSYDIDAIEVRSCTLPTLTPELLKSLGVDTQEELYEKVRNSLMERKTSQARFNQREELVSKLCDLAVIQIPASAIQKEAGRLVDEFANQQVRSGLKPEEVKFRLQGMYEKLLPVSEKRLKTGAILDKISKKENISITAKDVETMIWQDIYTNRLDAKKYVAELKKDESKLADVRKRAMRGKTLDHLMIKSCVDLRKETVVASADPNSA